VQARPPEAGTTAQQSTCLPPVYVDPATRMFSPAAAMTNDPWGGQVHPAFDVIAHSTLNLRTPANRHDYDGRGHSLSY